MNGNPAYSTYTYDAPDTLSQTHQVDFSPSGQVLEERLGATPSTATPKYQYVWGLGNVNDLVLRVDATTATRLYAQQDANGNVTALIDPTGAVQERYQYDPYGAVTVLNAAWSPLASSAFSWIYLFQGGRLDTSTGWYKFGARDYVPSQGTWAEPDPITFGAGNNFYQFVNGSPVGLTDPSGLAPPSWGWPSWEDYSRYLRNPSEMDSGLQTAQNVSLGVGLAAATAATGGALAAVGSTTAGVGTFVAASGASIAALEAGKSLYNGGDSGDAALAGARGAQEGVFLAQLPLMGSALLPKRLMPTRWPMSRGRNDCPAVAPNTGLPVSPNSTADLSKGSTLPRNLREQLAAEAAHADPTAGRQLPLKMNDPRWPNSDGWVKMQQMVNTRGQVQPQLSPTALNEGAINVHHLYNTATGEVDDFKIILPGVR